MAAQSFVFTVICGLDDQNLCAKATNAFKQKIKDGIVLVPPTFEVQTSGNVETITLNKFYFYETPATMVNYDREIYMGLATVTNSNLIFSSATNDGLAPGDSQTPSGEVVLQEFFGKLFEEIEPNNVGRAWQTWMVVPVDQVTASTSLGPAGGIGH